MGRPIRSLLEMPGRIWPHLHSLCPPFSYCQIKPPDHDTREHFPSGLDSLNIPKNGDYASSCSMYIGWIKGRSPPPPALSSPSCGVWVYTSQCCPQYILPFDVLGLFLHATLHLPTAISSEPQETFYHICMRL